MFIRIFIYIYGRRIRFHVEYKGVQWTLVTCSYSGNMSCILISEAIHTGKDASLVKLREVQSILKAEVFCCEEKLDLEVEYACGSDLMSDVLAFAHDKALLLTGLCNYHVIQTAAMIDALAVVFVRGKKPDKTVINASEKIGLPLLGTKLFMYDSCGLLYVSGLKGATCSIDMHGNFEDGEGGFCPTSEPS